MYGDMQAAIKDARIDLRLKGPEKELFERAAEARGQRLSEFVIASLTEAAEIALADQTEFTMSEEAFERFIERLERPPQAIPALVELFRLKSVIPGRSRD